MADPLDRLPVLGPYLAAQDRNRATEMNELKTAQQGLSLSAYFREQNEMEEMRRLLERGTGDPNEILPQLLRMGPKGAQMAKNYMDAMKDLEEVNSQRSMRRYLDEARTKTPAGENPRRGQARTLRQAAEDLALSGNMAAANRLGNLAKQLEIRTGTTPHIMKDEQGNHIVGVISEDAQFVPIPGISPIDKMISIDTGATVERVPAHQAGSHIKSFSPAQADASARGWAGLNQDVWSDSRGSFVPRPFRVGPGTPGYNAGGGQTAPAGPQPGPQPSPQPGPLQPNPLSNPGPRPLPISDTFRRELREATTLADTMKKLEKDFRPAYGGNLIMGGLENTLKRWFSPLEDITGTRGQAQWWSVMAGLDNLERHPLFGSAFTKPEQVLWRKYSVTERDDPKFIRESLRNRGIILENVLSRMQRSGSIRHDPREIEEITKRAIIQGSPGLQQQQQDTSTMDEETYKQHLIQQIREKMSPQPRLPYNPNGGAPRG